MDEMKPKKIDTREQEIVFSKSIKAGKRIYYIDVKRNRKDDLFVAITESKKIITGFDEDMQVSYEKHKIFLYKEDFDKFSDSLNEVIQFVKMNTDEELPKEEVKNEINPESSTTVTDDEMPTPTISTEFSMEEFEK